VRSSHCERLFRVNCGPCWPCLTRRSPSVPALSAASCVHAGLPFLPPRCDLRAVFIRPATRCLANGASTRAIASGLRSAGLPARLDALEQEKADLARKLSAPPPSPVRLHPNLAELYPERAAALYQALEREETGAEALGILRGLIERAVVHPREGGGFELELVCEVAAMVSAAGSRIKKPAVLLDWRA
jgi:hypothetical protein